MTKKNKQDASFTDDGFAMGECTTPEALEWFFRVAIAVGLQYAYNVLITLLACHINGLGWDWLNHSHIAITVIGLWGAGVIYWLVLALKENLL